MYKIQYTIDGIVRSLTINASSSLEATQMLTNMYGSGKIQIISIIKV